MQLLNFTNNLDNRSIRIVKDENDVHEKPNNLPEHYFHSLVLIKKLINLLFTTLNSLSEIGLILEDVKKNSFFKSVIQ